MKYTSLPFPPLSQAGHNKDKTRLVSVPFHVEASPATTTESGESGEPGEQLDSGDTGQSSPGINDFHIDMAP